MDTGWFSARMQLLGIVQEDVARALTLDRSTVSRIASGLRPLTIAEVEPLAAVLRVPAIEVIEHAHEWCVPIRTQTRLRDDLLRIAVSCAMAALQPGSGVAHEVARDAAGIYQLLVESEARGHPIDSDEAALALITETLRLTRPGRPES